MIQQGEQALLCPELSSILEHADIFVGVEGKPKKGSHQGRKSMIKHGGGGDNIVEKYTSRLLGGSGACPPPPRKFF